MVISIIKEIKTDNRKGDAATIVENLTIDRVTVDMTIR